MNTSDLVLKDTCEGDRFLLIIIKLLMEKLSREHMLFTHDELGETEPSTTTFCTDNKGLHIYVDRSGYETKVVNGTKYFMLKPRSVHV